MEPYDEDTSRGPAAEHRYGEPAWGGAPRPVQPEDGSRLHGLFTDVAH